MARQEYELGTIVSARDLGGTYNLNAHLQTAHGDFILRVYRPWVTSQRLCAIYTLKTRLSIDFDFVAIRERVFDIAYTLYWMFQQVEAGVEVARRSWQLIPEMLARYESTATHSLTSLERQSIAVEMARMPLYWVGESAFLPDPHRAVLGCAESVACADWIIAHQSHLNRIINNEQRSTSNND